MSGITICFNYSNDNLSIIVLEDSWLLNWSSSSFNSFLENTCCIINIEGNIFDTITVPGVMLLEFVLTIWVISCLENILNLSIHDNMLGIISVTGLKSLVCAILESKS